MIDGDQTVELREEDIKDLSLIRVYQVEVVVEYLILYLNLRKDVEPFNLTKKDLNVVKGRT